MAIIHVHKPVRRRVISGRGAHLVATMAPEGIYMREHKRRTAYLVPWGLVYLQGAKLEAARRAAEKLAERKARKAAKKRGS
jgi:hypothetical protein